MKHFAPWFHASTAACLSGIDLPSPELSIEKFIHACVCSEILFSMPLYSAMLYFSERISDINENKSGQMSDNI